ncbi:MAG TPA: hypothetical protein VHO24_09855 [Opitutaceae bacterium]|nr:hypothetical protein [Opitutaceae bacterium]
MKKSAFIPVALACLLSSVAFPAQDADATPALRSTLDTAHAAWKKDGGSEFGSGLTYVQGVPTLMVITAPGETAHKKLRRKRTLVSACEFLLDDAAFSKATICVIEADPRDPKKQTVVNVEVRRGNYQEALKKAAKVGDVKEAGRKAKETDSIVESVCTELGLK